MYSVCDWSADERSPKATTAEGKWVRGEGSGVGKAPLTIMHGCFDGVFGDVGDLLNGTKHAALGFDARVTAERYVVPYRTAPC